MTTTPDGRDDFASIRRQAEEKVRTMGEPDPENFSPDNIRGLIHELHVHQIELEMQNEELRRTHEALEISQARYFDLYDLAPVGYITLCEHGLIQEANLSAATLLGAPRRALIKQPLTHSILPEDQDIYYRCRKELLATGEPRACELRMAGQQGASFWARLVLSMNRDRENEAPVILAILNDISERKEAEEQLRIAAAVFESHEGTIVTDASNVILRVNHAFTTITGYSSEEAVGRTPALLQSGRQDTAFYRRMWGAIRNEGHWEGEIWNRRKDGGVYPEWLTISAIRNPRGEISHYVGVFSDISESREAQRKILELAYYDPLTSLPNRRLLFDRLSQALASSARTRDFGALLLLDLDRFKTLNDSRGHDVGDLLLIEVAKRLLIPLRASDTAARLGGDEFIVLLENLGEDELAAAGAAEAVAEKLRASLGQPCVLKGESCHITPSIGIALFRDHGEDAENLLKHADLALYKAKDTGRNAIRFFNPDMQAAIDARAKLEAGLRLALEQGELLLHYQPQVDHTGRLLGVEALLRWQSPEEGMVSPAAFIPVAEDSGLIVPIGHWVLETACNQLVEWAAHPATRDLRVAVNISARQFSQDDFIAQVHAVLVETGANPARLVFELTESLVLENVEHVIRTMKELKDWGIGFSLDDFGTGYSSLAYLKRLPLNELKIDQGFVRDIPGDPDSCAIAQAIHALGKSLRLNVIAEGVETEAQRDFLSHHGCNAFQGYLFGRPGPVEVIESLARNDSLSPLRGGGVARRGDSASGEQRWIDADPERPAAGPPGYLLSLSNHERHADIQGTGM